MKKKLDSIKCFTCTTLHFSSEFYFLHFHFTLINRLNLRNVYFDVMLGKNTQCNIKKMISRLITISFAYWAKHVIKGYILNHIKNIVITSKILFIKKIR